jgi:peptidoglycan hydrolase-like protein with peptidoglycan-binding domain
MFNYKKLFVFSLICLSFFLSSTKTFATEFAPSSCPALFSSDLSTEISNQIDSRIDGLSTSTGYISLFSTRGTVTAPWVKNADVWTDRVTPIDFSGHSVYNSTGGYTKAGTLISPRHIIFASHYPISSGATVVFIDSNEEIVTRTLTSQTYVVGNGGEDTDISIGLLSSDVPSTVTHYPILTEDQLSKYISGTNTPVILFDQEDKVAISNLSRVSDLCTNSLNSVCLSSIKLLTCGSSSTSPTRSLFFEPVIAGDSGHPIFSVINNKPFLLTHNLNAGSGSGPFYAHYLTEINAAMTALGGGYQASTYDTSCFTEVDMRPTITTPAPIFLNDNAVNGTIVGSIVATGSYAPFAYSIISGNTDNTFQISTTTGTIIVSDSTNLNYITTPNYNLSIQVVADSESGFTGSNRIATTSVSITVLPFPASTSSIAYFYSTSNTAWGTTANWFSDSAHTVPLTRIPNSTDAVFILGTVVPVVTATGWVAPAYINTSGVGNITFSGSGNVPAVIVGTSTFSGTTIFTGTSTGNVIFNTGTRNSGNIYGNVIFNGASYNSASVTGNVTYNDSSCLENSYQVDIITDGNVLFNYVTGTTTLSLPTGEDGCMWGTVNGTVKGREGQAITNYVFSSTNYNYGTVPGNAKFTSYARNYGAIAGDAIYSSVTGTTTITLASGIWGGKEVGGVSKGKEGQTLNKWIFNGSSYNLGIVPGEAVFNSTSYNQGTTTATTTFNTSSSNKGVVIGTAVFNGSTTNYSKIIGNAIFNNLSNTGSTGYSMVTVTSHITGNTIFNDSSYNNYFPIIGNVTFNGASTYSSGPITGNVIYSSFTNGLLTISKPYGLITGTVKGGDDIDINSWVFNTGGYNSGIVGSSTFNGTSYNNGTTTATTTFNDSSYNRGIRGVVNANAIFNGNLSNNYSEGSYGTITGTKTRHYSTTTDASTRDFITDGPWVVQSDNTTVTMSDRTKYDSSTTFESLNGGLFTGLIALFNSLRTESTGRTSFILNADILNGSVITPTFLGFNYGFTTDYGSTAVGIGTETLSATLSGLQCGRKTYHYNAFVTTSGGTATSSDGTFETGKCGGSTSYTQSEITTTNTTVEQPTTTTPVIVPPTSTSTLRILVVPSVTPSLLFTIYLKLGSEGAEVTRLQNFLIKAGYSLPAGATGYFGPQTQLALSNYQRYNNITPTGTFGPITRNSINNNTIPTTPATPQTPVNTAKYIFNNNLELNSIGEDVRQLQIYLNSNGFTVSETGVGSKGNESTFYGQKTLQAVKKYQEFYRDEILKPNGFTSGTGMFYEMTRRWVNGE